VPCPSPEVRALSARIAAHDRWGHTADRAAATAPARAAFLNRFEREADPDGVLPPDVRAKLAANLMSAHFARMALKSAQARRARGTVSAEDGAA
jgi:hypothetical protein